MTVIDSELQNDGLSRREIVTSPEFVKLKEAALEALE